LLLFAIVHAADVQDRDGGVLLMAALFGLFPFLRKLYADGGYQGPLFQKALARVLRHINVEIVKRSDHAQGFAVLPKRWIPDQVRDLAHHRMAEPLPASGQGLGEPQPQGPRLPQTRLHPPHAAKTLQPFMIFPDRL